MPGGTHPPASVIESWPPANYSNPSRQGHGLKNMSIVGAAIVFVIVIVRVYSRIFITRAFGWDDALAIISMVFTVALSALIIDCRSAWFSFPGRCLLCTAYNNIGLGRHIWDFPPQFAVKSRLNLWISEWCYLLASGSIKISVLLFYKRIAAPYTKAFWYATWIGIWYNVANVVVFGLCLLLLCRPLSAYWNQLSIQWLVEGRKYHCANEGKSLPASAAISLFGDVYSTILPLILVHGLQMRRRQKMALYALFALGFLVVASGIVRFYYLNYTINGTYDILWYLYIMWIWTLLELYAAITAASAPALRPFVARYLIDPFKSKYSSYGSSRLEDPASSTSGRGSNFSPFKYVKAKVLSKAEIVPKTEMETEASKLDFEMTPQNTIPENRITTQTTFTIRSDTMPEQFRADGKAVSAQQRFLYNKTRPSSTASPAAISRFQSPYSSPALRILTREVEQREAEHRTTMSTGTNENKKGSQGLSSHPVGQEDPLANATTGLSTQDHSDEESQHDRKVLNNVDMSPASSSDDRDAPNMPEHEPRDFVFDLDRDESDGYPRHPT